MRGVPASERKRRAAGMLERVVMITDEPAIAKIAGRIVQIRDGAIVEDHRRAFARRGNPSGRI